jgi:glycosyltransferase involved in cell wall biosynthesis
VEKRVYIISSGDIAGSKTAGAQRVQKIARSLAHGNITVYLCSLGNIQKPPLNMRELFPGVYALTGSNYPDTSKRKLIPFLKYLNIFIKSDTSESIIYLYPTTFIRNDFIYLIYFKFIKKYSFFCEINELRRTNAFSLHPYKKFPGKQLANLKVFYDYVAYWLSEYQAPFYDGIVVISRNLEYYFTRFNNNIIRIPILCDSELIKRKRPVLRYDGNIFKIGFAGSINSRKEGFKLFFEALALVNKKHNVQLYLYGNLLEKDRIELNDLATEYFLHEKVFYVGNFEPDRLPDELAGYHLLALPRPLTAQTKYGFSTKLSEYLVSGVPILLTDVSDNSLYFRDGYNAYIISGNSAESLADKISVIMHNYNNNADFIVEQAFETARNDFDYRLFSHVLINFFFNTSI